jgi:hypothetical protein
MAAAPIVAGGISAYGAIQAGQSTADSLNAQADIAMKNADEALAQGKYNAARQSAVADNKIGASIAAYGASGVATNYGSAAEVIGAGARNAELDRLNILHGADVKAINYRNQAAMDRYGADSAIKGSYWQALGDISGGLIKNAGYGSNAKTDITAGNTPGSAEDEGAAID